MNSRLITLVFVVATAASACTTAPLPTMSGLASSTISIDGRDLAVAVADNPQTRAQGLMGVTDLGDLDGMLFVFEDDTETGFWMKSTLIPLDIAFFAADGRFVDRLTMQPCIEDPCPTYLPGGPYRYAIEAPAGALEFVGEGSLLSV